MGTGDILLGGNPAMDQHPVQGAVAILSDMRHAKETGISSGRLGLRLVCAFTLFYKSKLTSTSRFSLKDIFRFWARVLTPFCPAVISWSFAVSATVSPILAASLLLLWFHSPGSVSELAQAEVLVSVLIHGELMTVSLLRVRVFGLLSGVPFPMGFLVLVLEDQGVVDLFSISFRKGYRLSLMQTAGLEHSAPESCKSQLQGKVKIKWTARYMRTLIDANK